MKRTIKRTILLVTILPMLFINSLFAQNETFGVHATELLSVPLPTLEAIASKLDSANVRWVRILLPWMDAEPIQGQWVWSDWETRLQIMLSHNLKFICMLMKVPAWASSAPAGTDPLLVPYYAPRDTLKWMVYVDSVVNKFKNYISYWEIWNEPDGGFLHSSIPGTKHRRYLELLRTAYTTIKQRDPTAKVVFAGLTSEVWKYPKSLFIDSVMALGAANYFDIMNVHFYRYTDTPVQKVQSLLAQYGKVAPIWVTETNNWRSLLPDNTEQRAADSLKPWLDYLRSLGPEKIFWFNLTHFTAWGPDSIAWGLFTKPDYFPSAIYTAYKNYIQSLATSVEQQETNPTDFLLFQNYPNPFNTSTTIRFSLSRREHVTLKVFDVLGNEIAILLNGNAEAGKNEVVFEEKNLTPGIYYCILQIRNETRSGLMLKRE